MVLFPSWLWAGGPPAAEISVYDVELDGDGRLVGRVTVGQQAAATGTEVTIARQGKPPVRARCGEDGYFAASGLSGGFLRIQTVSPSGSINQTLCRAWASGTGPPGAPQIISCAGPPAVVRGQSPYDSWGYDTSNPWITAAGLTALIATPIAVTRNDAS